MSDFCIVAVLSLVVAIAAGAVTYQFVRRDLSPSGALLAVGCAAVAVGAGWLLTLFHALLGFAIGLVVYLVARRRLTGTQAMVAGGAGYVVGTLLSVGALMLALSGM
ncbi:hypothetical protein ACFV2X_07190 [Streptomyces sp. NPDC059679]|uniref:hypothetical protein n=1 Tax=Streptomyces sp. NPDC059679 TaxID=3346903 RepID=UPI0036BEFA58